MWTVYLLRLVDYWKLTLVLLFLSKYVKSFCTTFEIYTYFYIVIVFFFLNIHSVYIEFYLYFLSVFPLVALVSSANTSTWCHIYIFCKYIFFSSGKAGQYLKNILKHLKIFQNQKNIYVFFYNRVGKFVNPWCKIFLCKKFHFRMFSFTVENSFFLFTSN